MGQSCCLGQERPEDAAGDARPSETKALPPGGPAGAAEAGEAGEAAAAAEPTAPSSLTLKLHSASLNRSFAKVGWMDPYAQITVDDKVVDSTKPDTWAHKNPTWESQFTWTSENGIPGSITVGVWDKNNYHKHVFCGGVTVPCHVEMGQLEEREFTLTKKGKPTGVVRITLTVENAPVVKQETDGIKRMPTLGLELDHVVSWTTSGKLEKSRTVQLQEAGPRAGEGDSEGEAEPAKAEAKPKAKAGAGGLAPALLGSWKCVDTKGLEDFLKATGAGVFQRKIALAARWPAWEYHASTDGKELIFVNHSAIGDLKEEFPLGEEYSWKDGHGNPMTCTAVWESTPEGGVLTTTRSGKIGAYSERREVQGDKLVFELTHGGTGVKWGRTFDREK